MGISRRFDLRYRIIPLGIILLLAASSQTFLPRVSAEAEFPVVTVGDFWEHEGSRTVEGMRIEGTTKLTVTGMDLVNAGGVDHHTFVFSLDGSGTFNALYVDMHMFGSWSRNGEFYYRETDLYLVKFVDDLEMSGTWSNMIDSGPLFISSHNTTTYELISDDWEYPINVGDYGTTHSKAASNINYHMEMGNGYNDNNYTEHVTYFENVTYSCLKTEKITVPAGDFDAYLVKIQEKDGTYQLKWYSPEVGAGVKYKFYDENGEYYGYEKLVSYSYKSSPMNIAMENLAYILLITMVPIVAAIVVLILLKRRRKKEYQTPQQYPKQPPYQPPT
jgi:hypothetical protein